MVVQHRCYISVQWAAIALQANVRARAQRMLLRSQRAAADQIAAAWKAHAARERFAALCGAACTLQAAHRARVRVRLSCCVVA
jgi:hypothetical protein